MKKVLFLLMVFVSLFASCSDQTREDDFFNSSSSSIPVSVIQSADSSFVTKNQALRIANSLTSLNTRAGESKVVSNVVALRNDVGDTLIYIVNYAKGMGYAVISATRNYHPVLATVDKGSFLSPNLLPEGEQMFLNNYVKRVSVLRKAPLDSVTNYRLEWANFASESVSSSSSPDEDVNSFINRSKVEWMNQGYDVCSLQDNHFGLDRNSRDLILRDAYAYKDRDDYMETSYLIRRPDAFTTTIGPLLSSEWGQGNPYNLLIVQKYNKDYLTGCVTTAMSQIMRYYKKPACYDWKNMPDVASSYLDGQAIAKLMFDIAESVHLDYGTSSEGGTSSNDKKAISTFKSFGYSGVKEEDHNAYDVENQIRYGKKPVYMRGSDGKDGHAWVCDGVMISEYDNQIYLMILSSSSPYYYKQYSEPTPNAQRYTHTSFHMNWGWNGNHNGWFSDDNISTGDHNFSSNRKDIINIY